MILPIVPSNEFIRVFKETPGAFSVCESIALMNICSQVPKGELFIECGSNAGKSGMSAAYGLPEGEFIMIDPIYDLKNLEAWTHTIQGHPDNLAWAYAAEPDFQDKVRKRIRFASNGRIKPILTGSFSEKELPKHEKYAYVFIDSDNHQKERVFAEVAMVRDRVISGGIIAFHDFLNQYIAPQEAHRMLIETGQFVNVPIDWKAIFDYVRENNLEDGNSTWHEKGSEEFPKFVGAVMKK